MSRIDRIYALDRLLRQARRPVPADTLMHRLECSRATLFRLIADLRDRRGAPLLYDRDRNGYYYERSQDSGQQYELPGLWFNSAELYALLVIQHLLAQMEPGLLGRHLTPLRARIEQILAGEGLHADEIGARVRILNMAARIPGKHFPAVAAALLQRRQLDLKYHARERDETTERRISPQRLVHYRDNWYLDAWCHQRKALRSFAVDRIRRCSQIDKPAAEIDATDLDAHYASAYGIFAGKANRTAVLRFTAQAARWVADERWHPEQRGYFIVGGGYELHVPYRDARELMMDIMRYGAEMEVVKPRALREEVAEKLWKAARQYPEPVRRISVSRDRPTALPAGEGSDS